MPESPAPVSAEDLPHNSVDRVVSIVRKSQPSIDRPRLTTESEKRLDDVERRTAASYAGCEELAHWIREVAEEIDADDE